jgi:hypothetical protein
MRKALKDLNGKNDWVGKRARSWHEAHQRIVN